MLCVSSAKDYIYRVFVDTLYMTYIDICILLAQHIHQLLSTFLSNSVTCSDYFDCYWIPLTRFCWVVPKVMSLNIRNTAQLSINIQLQSVTFGISDQTKAIPSSSGLMSDVSNCKPVSTSSVLSASNNTD